MTPETITPELLKSLTALLCAVILICTVAILYSALIVAEDEGYGKIGLVIGMFLFATGALILVA